jgi:hypothetical protein
METGRGRKLRHNGCTAGNFDLPDNGFFLHSLPVPMAARITKYLNKYVRSGISLIYMSSFYFWSLPLARKMRKTSTGPMEWSTGNSYQAEALTNALRYHICRSSHPEDRKLPITELKWDARTVTDIQIYTVRLSIRPLIGVNNVKPMFGGRFK